METSILWPLFTVIAFLMILFSILRTSKKDIHSHWSLLLPNFKYSTKDFYKRVVDELLSHEIKDITFEEVDLKTGGLLSHGRMYLRITWEEHYYDLCFAPFGDGCFVSWWLVNKIPIEVLILGRIPIVGGWILRSFLYKTYYEIDTASMFMTYSHHSVLAVIDEITKETGIRISEAERKPNLKNIFDR